MRNNSLSRNGLYNIVGGLLKLGLGILTIPVLIRTLGTEQYGLWSFVLAIVGILTLAEGGLATSTTVFVSQDLYKDDRESLSRTLTSSLTIVACFASIAACTLWSFSHSVSIIYPKLTDLQSTQITVILQFGSVLVWLKVVQQILVGIEQAFDRYDLINIITSIASISTSLGTVIVAVRGGDLLDLMKLQIVSSVVVLIIHLMVVNKLLEKFNICPEWNLNRSIDLGKYSFPLWLSSLGTTAFTKLDRIIVGNILGPEGLGLYSGITDVVAQINSLSALPVQPIVPIISKLSDKPSKIFHQVEQCSRINALVSVLMCVSLNTFSKECTQFLFIDKSSNTEIWAFQIAVVIYSLYSLNAVGYYILIASKSPGVCTAIVMFGGGVSLILITVLSNRYGIIGSLVGNSGYLTTLTLCWVACKKIGMPLKNLIHSSVAVPLMWAFSITTVNVALSLIHNEPFIKLIILIIECVPIIYWYFSSRLYFELS